MIVLNSVNATYHFISSSIENKHPAWQCTTSYCTQISIKDWRTWTEKISQMLVLEIQQVSAEIQWRQIHQNPGKLQSRHRHSQTRKTLKRLYIAVNRKTTAELQYVTCYKGSHSVTCHPTQVNAPCLTAAKQAGTQLPIMEGWNAKVTPVVGYILI